MGTTATLSLRVGMGMSSDKSKKGMGRWCEAQAHLSVGDSPHDADHQLAQDEVERLLGIVQVDRCGIPNDKSCSAPPWDLALRRALICRLDCPNIAIHPNNLSGGHSFFRGKICWCSRGDLHE
jgi:hypothetical protein